MAADLSKYKFSADLTKGSAGDFKSFLKDTYGYQGRVKGLTAKEINKLVDREYGTEVDLNGDEVTDTPNESEPSGEE